MNRDELWRQCVEWLVLVGALPPTHKARYPDSVVFDLAQTLRDGVVLCNTLNIIAPGVVDESQINFRAQMSEFLCMQNIRVVIQALHSYFRIPAAELFNAQDLYQMTNFEKVLNALSYLSSIPEISSRYQQFYPNSRLSTQRSSFEDEDIYRNLPELASERALADEDEDLYDSVPEEVKDEGIYGSLIDLKRNASVTSSQKLDKRGCCIHEIVETENNYVTHLVMMVEQFMIPLRQCLSEQDIKTIFMNIEQLRPIHTSFRDELVKLQRNGQNAKFSQPFIQYREKFLIYGDYCSNLVDAQDHLEECSKNEEVRLKIEECQMSSSRNKFKLRDLLCVPMQRILKYHLLVKELNKHTTDGHVDKPNMPQALTSMQELSLYINEVKRDSEELIKINQIEARLEEYDQSIPLREYGRVRYDGELKVKFADDKNISSRYVFLSDKALFMSKLKNDSYILKDLIRLEDMQLDEMPNQKQTGGKWSWVWKLFSMKQGVRNYMLYAKTLQEKAKWLEAFKDSADNISPRALKGKKHNFEMQTFAEPTTCSSCQLLLKGIFYQGYECTVTNARCHKQCLADTLKLIEDKAIDASTKAGRNKDKAPPVPQRGGKRPNPSQAQKPPSSQSITVGSLSYKAHRQYTGTPAPPFPNAPIITFNIGEPIEVLEQVTSDWWKGKSFANYDKIGYFPASYVSPIGVNTEKGNPAFVCASDDSSHISQAHYSSHADQFKAIKRQHGVDNNTTSTVIVTQENSHHRLHEENFDTPKPCPSSPEQLKNYYWYAGEIDRNEAEKLLLDTPSGTFLIRRKAPLSLVISLKFQKDIKHIRILQTDDGMHYVAECKNFKSVQDLVTFYQNNSLSGFFLGLETTLRFPYRDPVMFPGMPSPISPLRQSNYPPQPSQRVSRRPQNGNGWQSDIRTVNGRSYDIIGQARAQFPFEARSEQELSLRAGQIVNIISKAGSSHGWWKGEHSGQVGYFPTTFVIEI
ncbi:proto-oncogene vav-like isoform X1 [Styela clava]